MTGDVMYERELRIAASPSTIFDLLTDSDSYSSWMGFGAELDAWPGGIFKLNLGAAFVRGEFVEVVPHSRVVIAWGWEGDAIPLAPGESTVEFTLVPDGDGTIVRMRHSGLTPALRDFHAFGWDLYLPRLEAVATGRDPGIDPLTDPPLEVFRQLLRQGEGQS